MADSSDNKRPELSSNIILSLSSASVFKVIYALLLVASSKSKLTEWWTTICSLSSVSIKSGEVLFSNAIAPPIISTSALAPPPFVPELLNTTLSPTTYPEPTSSMTISSIEPEPISFTINCPWPLPPLTLTVSLIS